MKKESEKKLLPLWIESDLKKEFNIKCIKNNTTMSEFLRNTITEYIKNN